MLQKVQPTHCLDWQIYVPWPWTRIVFIDGSYERGPSEIMRRRTPEGKWQYRRCTEAEIRDWLKWL
jgi:hypothetical protein